MIDIPPSLVNRFTTLQLLLAATACAVLTSQSPVRAADLERLQDWGLETYSEINRTLAVPGTRLYAETASLSGAQSGGLNGRSFVWPESTQFRVLNTLTQLDPGGYAPSLRLFADELHTAYWNNGYRSGAGGGDRFYDDNAHLVVAYVEAFRLTNDSAYLSRARDAFSFVLQGEDAVAGGGIYFRQGDFSSKDAISTLQGARGAAMLYRATGEPGYLSAAMRLLTWAKTHIQRADGLFSERWKISTNAPDGFDLVNSAGIGISTNLELYGATGNAAYLLEAQRLANRSLSRYFDSATGRINDEGFWAFELVDALDSLYLYDHNSLWLDRVDRALGWLYNNKRDPNEHYGRFWGRNGPQVGALASWDLNDQAPVNRAYLYTGAISEPPPSAWSVDAGGDWSNVTHWTVFKPNLPGATAVFGNKITAPRTITVDMPITVGRIDFASANAYTIAGNNTLTLDATTGDAQINVTSGNHAMNTAVSLLDNTVITVSPAGSTLSMTGAVSASSVNVTKSGAGMLAVKNLRAAALVLSGGTMVLQPDGGILTVRTLSIAGEPTAPAAMLDLTSGSAIVDYPNGGPNPETTLRAQIISGRGGSGLGKTWNAAGITSSQAAADPVNTTSVGYANNATMPLGSMTNFRGQAVDPSTVLIRYTRTGDANLDGIVNNNDVTIVGSNYAPGIPKPSWAFGDFDYNGFVDNDDVTLLGVNYNPDASPIPAPEPDSFNEAAVVPEPDGFKLLISASAITLLALIVASWIRNRAIVR